MGKIVKTDYDIIIGGAGLVGLITALACASQGASIALIEAVDPGCAKLDTRSSAIAATSLIMLGKLGVTKDIETDLQPITDMLISEGSIGSVSPSFLHFDSQDVDGPTSYMIENNVLKQALLSAAQTHGNITIIAPAQIINNSRGGARIQVTLDSGQKVTSRLLVAADGRHSALRQSAAIGVSQHDYKQKALVTTFTHEFPHDGVAHQIFFMGGPLALLPLTQNRMSLVWSDKAEAIEAALELSEDAFLSELRRRMGDFLGQMFLCAPRRSYPLSLQMAESYTAARLALVGDAAHAIHPLAGQGLNMGFRDAAALADVIANARAVGLDIGGAVLEEYEVWRKLDNQLLGLSTDFLNALFSNNITPLKHVRRLGLAAINRHNIAKNIFMQEASGELGILPSLLRRS